MPIMRTTQRLARTGTTAIGRSAPARHLHASAARAFLFRSRDDLVADGKVIATPHGESRRFLVRADGCGFSMHHEVFRKSSEPVRLDFRNHVYAVMVTKGRGRLQLFDAHDQAIDRHEHVLEEGSLFALSAAEPAGITVESDELHVVSVMNPPLVGPEKTNPATGVFPVIDADNVAHESFDHASIRRLCEPPESLKGGSSPMKDDPLF